MQRLAALAKAGARVIDIALAELKELPRLNAKGGLSAAESYAIHRGLIGKSEQLYDPRVLVRILRGREQDAADYIDLVGRGRSSSAGWRRSPRLTTRC